MRRIASVLGLCLALFTGCSKKGPPELTLDQIPAALTAAFASGSSLLKQNAEGIVKLLEQKQYAAASVQLQALSSNTTLTDEQRIIVGGATIALNAFLQQQVAAFQEEPAPDAAAAQSAKPSAPPAISREEAAAAAAAAEHYVRTK
jgi:hypothetical protein